MEEDRAILELMIGWRGWPAYSETGTDDKRKEMMGTRMSGRRIGGDRNENGERCEELVEEEE